MELFGVEQQLRSCDGRGGKHVCRLGGGVFGVEQQLPDRVVTRGVWGFGRFVFSWESGPE